MSARLEGGVGVGLTLLMAALAAFGLPSFFWAVVGGVGFGLIVRAALTPPGDGSPQAAGSSPTNAPANSPTFIGEGNQIIAHDVSGGIHLHSPPPEDLPPEA